MRPFDFRNCAGQADDLAAWGITVGDRADYRLFSGLHMMTVGVLHIQVSAGDGDVLYSRRWRCHVRPETVMSRMAGDDC